jgi:hypothetical protein
VDVAKGPKGSTDHRGGTSRSTGEPATTTPPQRVRGLEESPRRRFPDIAGRRLHHDRGPRFHDVPQCSRTWKTTWGMRDGSRRRERRAQTRTKCPPLEEKIMAEMGSAGGLVAGDELRPRRAVGKRGERRLTDRRCAV